MSTQGIPTLLSRVRSLGSVPRTYTHRGEPTPFALACAIEPPVAWDQPALEVALGGELPDDIRILWNESAGLRLFEDREYGQWGLVLWPPQTALGRTLAERSDRPDADEAGDLVLGEFLGDAERLVVRCTRTAEDFGHVYVTLPIDPRTEWESPAGSPAESIARYLDAQGDKFWEARSPDSAS